MSLTHLTYISNSCQRSQDQSADPCCERQFVLPTFSELPQELHFFTQSAKCKHSVFLHPPTCTSDGSFNANSCAFGSCNCFVLSHLVIEGVWGNMTKWSISISSVETCWDCTVSNTALSPASNHGNRLLSLKLQHCNCQPTPPPEDCLIIPEQATFAGEGGARKA